MSQNAQGWYSIAAFRGAACVYWRTTTQRRGVWSAVQRSLADYRADLVMVTREDPGLDGSSYQVAQVTSAGFWKFTARSLHPQLAEYIEKEQAK